MSIFSKNHVHNRSFHFLFLARRSPFVVGVNFDDDEIATASGTAKLKVNEQMVLPGGIIGFKLYFWQVAC